MKVKYSYEQNLNKMQNSEEGAFQKEETTIKAEVGIGYACED